MASMKDVVRRVAPKALPAYVAAIEAYAEAQFAQFDVTTPLRRAHFLAQILHESGGLTIVRESMKYTAPRIMAIFGVGKHTARVTQAEAAKLAGDEYALAERVYGLGNPSKAKELGNLRPGDGFLFRGNGPLQTTGGAAHKDIGRKCGVGTLFFDEPSTIMAPELVLLPALIEWQEGGCNALADKNDIRSITRKINGGYNGLADREAWFDKVWPLVRAANDNDAWQVADIDDDMLAIQKALNALGLGPIAEDGRFGPKTKEAVQRYQKFNALIADGIPGPVTCASIELRLAAAKAPRAA
ncbi:MAG: peptidoglycan-binding protein [Pseudomonadota bacterium]